MALPKSGPISISMIIKELYGNTILRNVSLGCKDFRKLANKPSGQIKMSDFYGKPEHKWVELVYDKDSGNKLAKSVMDMLRDVNQHINERHFVPKLGFYWDITDQLAKAGSGDPYSEFGYLSFRPGDTISKDNKYKVVVDYGNFNADFVTDEMAEYGMEHEGNYTIGYRIYVWE